MTSVANYSSTLQFQTFDKGLRSRSLGDQLSTVVSTASLMKGNPFPMFVNKMIVRLSEAFKEGSNEMRLCVARVMADCACHLPLVFSSAEILKRIMTVSHSNDPEARAITLQMLANLAELFPDDKEVHHLIVESLGTSNAFEFKCACNAMIAFSTLSAEFSAIVIEKVGHLLVSPETSLERKAQMVPVFAQMKADVETTQQIFGLSCFLLETCTQNALICSVLDSVTSLAEATRYGISDQLSGLVSLVARCEDKESEVIALCALANIDRLAVHAHRWTDAHLKSLCDLRPKLESRAVLFGRYLEIFATLSRLARPVQAPFFQGLLVDFGYLLASGRLADRVSFLRIACFIHKNQPSEELASRILNAFTCVIGEILPRRDAKKLYRMLSRFLQSTALPESIMTSLVTSLVLLPGSHSNIDQIIDLFCELAQRHPAVVEPFHEWAKKLICERPDLLTTSISYLLLAPTVDVPNDSSTLAPGNDWNRYIIARTAFRNGHWRTAALPNLEAIDTKDLSLEFARWIKLLVKLASSQLEEFSVKSLETQLKHLTEADSTAQVLLSSALDPSPFAFPANYVNCLRRSTAAVYEILSGLNTFLHMPQQFLMRGTAVRVRNLLTTCQVSVRSCIDAWCELARSAFGADAQSLDCVSLLRTVSNLLHYGLRCLAGEKDLDPVRIPVLCAKTTISLSILRLLTWSNGQLQQLNGTEITRESLNHFVTVLKALSCQRFPMPRFFFQQLHSIDIKLAVTSLTTGELTAPPNKLVPIQLDGVISATRPTRIDLLTITAKIVYFTAQGSNTTHKATVRPKDRSYFTTNFVMQFKQSCTVEFSVDFVDYEQGKPWRSSSSTSLKVVVNE